MSIRPILTAPDPRLKVVSEATGKVDEEMRRLIDDMVESMYAADGIGLAAVQIGVPKRIIVMDIDQKDGKKNPRVFVDPKILWASDELATFEEGCLSIPEIWEDVERQPKSAPNISTAPARARRLKRRACSRPACSTRWIISRAFSSSIISRRLKRSIALRKLQKAKRLKDAG